MTAAAIVLAGGRGERLRPLTDECPKPLLELGTEPVIAHPLRRLARAGITDVVLAISYLADQFEPRLGDGRPYGVRLRYAAQDRQRGTAGGFLPAVALLGPADPIVVLNADELGSHDLLAQLAAFADAADACGAVGSVHVRQVSDRAPFGAVEVTGGRITAFEEKPLDGGPGLANAGCYVFAREVVDSVAARCARLAGGGNDWSMSLERDVLPDLIASGSVLVPHRDDSPGLDVGTAERLSRAAAHLARIERDR